MDTVKDKVRKGVLEGRDGWLFLFSGAHEQFAYLTGAKSVPSASVTNFYSNIARRREFCARRNITYMHIVFPSKPVVMSEFLPESIRQIVKSTFHRFYAEGVSPDLHEDVYYPRGLLLSLNKYFHAFRKYDTHMSDKANMLLAEKILQTLSYDIDMTSRFYELEGRRPSDLRIMLGLNDEPPEQFLAPNVDRTLVYDNMKYLPGNTGHIKILRNASSASSKRLLVFGDSFSNGLLKYYSQYFRDVIYFRSSHFHGDAVDLVNPDCVITGNTERYLRFVASDSNANSVLFSNRPMTLNQSDRDFNEALVAQLSFRHYPNTYDQWSREADRNTGNLLSYSLSINQQINAIRDLEYGKVYVSVGRDPQMIITPHEDVSAGKLSIQFFIHSEQTSFVDFFPMKRENGVVVRQGNGPVRRNINAGWNKIDVILPIDEKCNLIRFDPLACAGKFIIEGMKVIRSS